MSLQRKILFSLFTIPVIYFVYIWPVRFCLNFFIDASVFNSYFVIATFFMQFLFVYYMLSSSSNFLLKGLVYGGMGTGFLASSLSLILIFVSFFIEISTTLTLLVFSISLGVFLVISFASPLFLKVRRFQIFSNKLTKKKQIVFVSDIHLGSNSSAHLSKIIAQINTLKPDCVLIGGDLVDKRKFDMTQLSLFNKLSVPIYFVTGNHEYYLLDVERFLARLNDYNITLITDNQVRFDELNIIGIDDAQSLDSQLNNLKKCSNEDLFNICMVHKPQLWPKGLVLQT